MATNFTEELNKIYKSRLGRDPDSGGAAYWKKDFEKAVAAGGDPSAIIANIDKAIHQSTEGQNRPKKEEPKVEAKAKELSILKHLQSQPNLLI